MNSIQIGSDEWIEKVRGDTCSSVRQVVDLFEIAKHDPSKLTAHVESRSDLGRDQWAVVLDHDPSDENGDNDFWLEAFDAESDANECRDAWNLLIMNTWSFLRLQDKVVSRLGRAKEHGTISE